MLPIPTSSFGPTFTFNFTLALTLFGILGNLSLVRGFSFNTSTPTQCGELTVQWDGGSEPFEISLVPTISVPGGRIRNITIPRGLTQPYRYSFLLNEPAGLEFLASMSDSNGFGTGGTTGVLTVGSSDNNTCVDSNLQYSFFFQTSTNSPTQCNPMSISWPNNVTAPVNLYGLIPGGTAFQLPIPQPPSTSYDWPVNIAEGTQFLLYMSDAGQAQTGGSTQLLRVGGGSTGCMNSTSPRAGGSLSGTGTASPSASGAVASVSGVGGSSSGGGSNGGGGNGSGGGSTKSNTGAIAGGVVGGVAFLVLLAALLFFCCRRKARERRGSSDTSVLKNYGAPPPGEKSGRLDILGGVMPGSDRRNARGRQWSDQETRVGEEGYEPSPFRYPSPPTSSQGAALLAGGAGAGVAAGAGVGAGVGGRKAQEAANERNMNASQQRMSGENGHPFTMGTDTGNGSGTRDSYESTRTPPRSMDHTGYGGTGTGTNSESIPRTPTSQAHGFPPTITAFPFGGNGNGNVNGAKAQGSPLRANHPALATGHGYNDNDSTGASGRDEMSQGGRTDMATLGHDAMGGTNANANVQRGNSTRKTGFGNVTGVGAGTGPGATGNGGVPPSPTQGFPRRGVDEGLMGDSHGDHGGAGAGAGLGLGPSPGEGAVGSGLGEGPETRFVQHEDVGPVVDLPPRYDQLRARNPDIAQA